MKRFLQISFIALALVVGAAGAAPAAHAAVCAPGYIEDVNGNAEQAADGTPCTPDTSSGTAVNAVADEYGVATPPPDPVAAKSVAGGLPKDPDGSEGFGKVMTWIMSLFAWLVGAAAVTLDYAVYYTVVVMGNYVNNLSAVGVTWQIMRDIGNIVIIFGFLAIGICTILDVKWYGGGTKMLPMLLVGAIFLNFSLFMTEAIIDTGNLFATQFYTQIKGGELPTDSYRSNTTFMTQIEQEGISNKIMSQLGLADIYGKARTNTQVLKAGNTWFIGFMGILLFLITAFVMFSLAFILIARFVILLFLIIIAPIGFAGLAIPNLSGLAKKWWDKLVEQTITAPVLLLCLYIALRIITDVNFLTGFCTQTGAGSTGCTKNWAGFIAGNDIPGFASLLLSFLVAMGLLIAVVIISKQLSAFGAAQASKLAGMASFGAVSLAGRATLGGLGGLLASQRMQSWARRGGVRGGLLKTAVFTGNRLKNRTYDMRSIPGASTLTGALGVDAGKGSTWTPSQVIKADFGRKPVKEFFAESAAEREKSGHLMDFRDAQSRLKAKRAEFDKEMGPFTPDQQKAREERFARDAEKDEKIIAEGLAQMSAKEIEELTGIKNGIEDLVKNLSPQQFSTLMKSDKLTDVEKDKIRTTRYKPLDKAVASGDISQIKGALGLLSKGELESMPARILNSEMVLNNLSDKQRDTLTDGNERTAAEKTKIRNTSKTGKVEIAFKEQGATAAAVMISGLDQKQAAKLRGDILKTPEISRALTTAMLRTIMREEKFSPEDLRTIKDNIVNGGGDSKVIEYLTTGVDARLWPEVERRQQEMHPEL